MKPTKRRGHERVEHHRAAAALRLARADERERALGGLVADRLGVELRPGRGPSPTPRPGHEVGALAREGGRVGPGLRGLVASAEKPRELASATRALGVRVDRVLDLR